MITLMSLRPRIRLRWYVLGVIAGMCAAFVTYWWLDGPRWRDSSEGPGWDPFFSADGNTLSTFHGVDVSANRPLRPRIVQWDTSIGRKISVVPFEWTGPAIQPNFRLMIAASANRRRILVGTILTTTIPGCIYGVYDPSTGARIAGPISADHWIRSISTDGRWCAILHFDGSAIVEVDSGAIVRTFDRKDSEFPRPGVFAPDGLHAAVLWQHENKDHAEIALYELPSGSEIRRFDLPARRWQQLIDWERDNRLYIECREPALYSPPGTSFLCTYSFDLTDLALGAERYESLRSTAGKDSGEPEYWQAGNDWVAHLTEINQSSRSLITRVFAWIDRLCNTTLSSKSNPSMQICMLNSADGNHSWELADLPYARTLVSDDGRWIASVGDAVEVWSVPPPRQTLWATCAGLATLGIVFAVGHRRSRPRSNISGQIPTLSA